MPRLSDLEAAASTMTRTAFSTRYPTPVLVPVRIIGGSVRRSQPQDRNATMMHGARDWERTAIEVASAVTLAPGAGGRSAASLLRIGRDWSCDVKIADYTVSKSHAIWRPGKQRDPDTLEDQGSRNGTWVGKTRLKPGQPHPVRSGDEVRFGRMVLTFYKPAQLYDFLRESR